MSGKRVTAAVVQAAPVGFDAGKTIDKLGELTAQAAARGAQIVVFPEAFVGSYPKGLDFGARLGSRTPAGREDFRRYFEAAIALPGPELDRICTIARKTAMHLVAGVIEQGGGTLYCTVVFIGPDGTFLGKHRKLMPTAMERIVWGFGDGSTMPVIDTPVGKVGAVICWENYMPMMRMAMYAKGIELYCAPTVDDRDQWHHAMRHIGWEGRCFVLCACQHTRRRDFPADYDCIQGSDPDAVLIRGGSVIVSPFGEVLAGPVYGEDAVLTAELDLDEIARGKYDLDVTGHYARPDVFQLQVNEAPQRPVRVVVD
jgi:nitrilase